MSRGGRHFPHSPGLARDFQSDVELGTLRPMLVRRISGMITALLMLHLTFVGADLACAEHGDRSADEHRGMMAHHEHHTTAAHTEGVTATDQPCETPTQPQCCHAMTSCAVGAALERGMGPDSVPPIRDVIESAIMRLPLSQVTSPDPPPPKA